MRICIKKVVPVFLVLLLVFINLSSAYAVENNPYVTLKVGSRGEKVSQLQQALSNKGYATGSIDGIYGQKTKNAVIQFQKASKITVDGIAGKQTQSVLYAIDTATTVSRGTSINRSSESVDLHWLSRIIEAEAGSEPYAGKVAVGNVILNRVESNLFPKTIKDVIFEYYNGIPQFSPVADGTIYNTPSEECVKAAKAALNNEKPVGSSTYFFNPDKATAKWIVNNKTYVTRIGDHVFYK